MAKKSSLSTGGSTSIFDIVKSVDKSTEILAESKCAVIKDYINTGSYILNAAMTGSLFRGVPNSRVTLFSGSPGSGKTYIALSVCREAQKKGYTPIYMDSEGSIDKDFVARLGCDPKNFLIKQVTTISEVSSFMANILKGINEAPEDERPKVIFVLDSLGNLTSDKEYNDTLTSANKRDMTKQQETKALFRTNATAIAKAGAIFIVNTHCYNTMDLFSKTVVSGGSGVNYNASITMMLTTAKLDDKESDKVAEKKTGDFIKTGVIVTAKPEKSRFTIPQKVKFVIPFFKKPNPYIGLEPYLDWDNFGVMVGELLDEKSYSKLSESEKSTCSEMADENGVVCYAHPKESSKKIVVRHLGKEIPKQNLFTPEVFTEELLKKMDELVIRPNFELPSNDSNSDIEEFIDGEDA